MKFLVDEILQAFESEGNLHLILGLATGKQNEQGDIKEPQTTIIIPISCSHKFLNDLSSAITYFVKDSPQNLTNAEVIENKEWLGLGIKIK